MHKILNISQQLHVLSCVKSSVSSLFLEKLTTLMVNFCQTRPSLSSTIPELLCGIDYLFIGSTLTANPQKFCTKTAQIPLIRKYPNVWHVVSTSCQSPSFQRKIMHLHGFKDKARFPQFTNNSLYNSPVITNNVHNTGLNLQNLMMLIQCQKLNTPGHQRPKLLFATPTRKSDSILKAKFLFPA